MSQSDLVSCPFNVAHKIVQSKMSKHVLKCRKQYPEMKADVCDFNSSHWVLIEDLQEHMKKCPSKEDYNKERNGEYAYDETATSARLHESTNQKLKPNSGSTSVWRQSTAARADSHIKPGSTVVFKTAFLKSLQRKIPPNLTNSEKEYFANSEKRRLEYVKNHEYYKILDLVYPQPYEPNFMVSEIIDEDFIRNYLREYNLEQFAVKKLPVGCNFVKNTKGGRKK